MRSVTIFLIASASVVGLISGCQASAPKALAPRLVIPATSPPAGWIEIDTKIPETSICVPKGWTSDDTRSTLCCGDFPETILKAEGPQSKLEESVAEFTIQRKAISGDFATRSFTSDDLAKFVGTDGNPRLKVKSSALVSLPCGEAMFRAIEISASSEMVAVEDYSYSIRHGPEEYFVTISIPQTNPNPEQLQRSIIASLKIKE